MNGGVEGGATSGGRNWPRVRAKNAKRLANCADGRAEKTPRAHQRETSAMAATEEGGRKERGGRSAKRG